MINTKLLILILLSFSYINLQASDESENIAQNIIDWVTQKESLGMITKIEKEFAMYTYHDAKGKNITLRNVVFELKYKFPNEAKLMTTEEYGQSRYKESHIININLRRLRRTYWGA